MTRLLAQPEFESFPSFDWPEVAPRLSIGVRDAIEQVMETLDGGTLTREQCLMLSKSEGDDLLGLAEHRVIGGPALCGQADTHIHVSVGCEFDGV